MNSETVQNRIDYHRSEIDRQNLAIEILQKCGESLSESISISPGAMMWIFTSDRKDVEALMTLAPKWTKTRDVDGTTISYSAVVAGHDVTIKASEGALPPTCKLVEEEYEVPAEPAKPARMAKRMVLKCPQPAIERQEQPQ